MIEAAVEKLPRPMRVVFMLRDVEELSASETAEQLGVPAATVKTRLHRARKQLRKQLGAEIAVTLSGTFPFAENRYERMADQILERLRDPGPPAGTAPASPVESFVHRPDQIDGHQVGLHQVENPRMSRSRSRPTRPGSSRVTSRGFLPPAPPLRRYLPDIWWKSPFVT